MKNSSTIGLILASILLALSFRMAFADQENATLKEAKLENLTNMTLQENTTGAVFTNVNTDTIKTQNKSSDMIGVSIIKRRLKEGKTYEDFRKAWYHTVGFGTPAKLYTAINVSDPREIIVIGFVDYGEADLDELLSVLRIDVKERHANPLDEVIEPEIGREFGILVSEDDFSAAGTIEYKPPSISGKETDLEKLYHDLSEFGRAIAQASFERDHA